MNRQKLAFLILCAIMALMLACAASVIADDAADNKTSTPSPASPMVIADADYRIQEEDVLRMDVWGEPQLSNMQMQVTPDGKINVAYIGEVQAQGLTQADITSQIAKKFEEAQILINPKVVVTLISIHRPTVRVLGAVQKSGEFQFKEGKDRILDAVAQAGYVPDAAWLERATLTRNGVQTTINLQDILNGKLEANIFLEKGDVINIPPEEYANKFYVMGEVNRPMMYDLKDKTKVFAALNLAGGPTQRAALSATMVIRGDPKKPEKIPCDIAKMISKGDLTGNIELQDGDVLYVPETKKPDWGKISQIISTISSFTYIRRNGLF